MLAEAKRCVPAGLAQDWKTQKTNALSIAKEEGQKAGYENGSQDGRVQGKGRRS
jgi:hypothetical protein